MATSFGDKKGERILRRRLYYAERHCARGMCVMKTANQWMIAAATCHPVNAARYSSIADHPSLSIRFVVMSPLTMCCM